MNINVKPPEHDGALVEEVGLEGLGAGLHGWGRGSMG